jgi:hypothetical protein
VTKLAIVSDEHFPFQDDKARSVALKVVRDFNPDILAVGLDGIDFYQISSFDKDPARVKVGLQEEINAWKSGQREWKDAAPNAVRYFIPGNHEDRHRRYLWRHPEIASLDVLKLEAVLELDDLGIKYEEDKFLKNEEINIDNVVVIKHGSFVRKGAAMSARAELENEHYSISTLTGHTHRGGSYFARTRTGMVQAHECFCLCRLDPDYVKNPDWQQGIILAEVVGDVLSVESVAIKSSRRRKVAVWRGKEYRE